MSAKPVVKPFVFSKSVRCFVLSITRVQNVRSGQKAIFSLLFFPAFVSCFMFLHRQLQCIWQVRFILSGQILFCNIILAKLQSWSYWSGCRVVRFTLPLGVSKVCFWLHTIVYLVAHPSWCIKSVLLVAHNCVFVSYPPTNPAWGDEKPLCSLSRGAKSVSPSLAGNYIVSAQ